MNCAEVLKVDNHIESDIIERETLRSSTVFSKIRIHFAPSSFSMTFQFKVSGSRPLARLRSTEKSHRALERKKGSHNMLYGSLM